MVHIILNALTSILVLIAATYFARRLARAIKRKGTDESRCCSGGCSEKRGKR